jgi:glucose/arabinose dehydrogenase
MSFGSGSMNQGMLFTPGFFYYQDGTPPGTKIMRVPYANGDLKPSATPEVVADVNGYTSTLHWPKTLDVADDGSIYVGNGSDQGEGCVFPHPFHGGILKIDPAPGGPNPNGAQIAKGFRNPIAVRCARGKNQCFALELALDYSAGGGGREKMIPIRQGDDWGFPCCAAKGLAYPGVPYTDCSGVSAETVSFLIGDTPFGLAFEPGTWPGSFKNSAFIATHGAAGSWTGARIVAVTMDPSTGLPVPGSDNMTPDTGGMTDFATGWDDGSLTHGRPAALTFSPDGRLFVANDNTGVIFWIAAMD